MEKLVKAKVLRFSWTHKRGKKRRQAFLYPKEYFWRLNADQDVKQGQVYMIQNDERRYAIVVLGVLSVPDETAAEHKPMDGQRVENESWDFDRNVLIKHRKKA